MPELPEVETVKNQLKALLVQRTIQDIDLIYPGIVKMDVEKFKQRLIGQKIVNIHRYGKYLIFEFESVAMVSHLRMEGKYFIRQDIQELTKHDHLVFKLDHHLFLSYHDTRKFGTMELIEPNEISSIASLKNLGPEINSEAIDSLKIYRLIQSSTRKIKTLLLDQSIVAGLGNIYVDETLFLAGVHPETLGNALSYKQFALILDCAKKVIQKAIQLGGTTIRSYHSLDGIDGRFQNELNVHLRQGEQCGDCNDRIIKTKVGGRGTYLCPTCQKKVRL